MTVVTMVALALLLVAAAGCLVRLVRPSSAVDRALALDTLTAVVISAAAVSVVATGDGVLADLALMLGLVGFLTTVTIARFVGRRGP